MGAKVSRFEHFEILKDDKGELVKLGPGGMGTTYRAYDLHLRKLVALKIINDRTLPDPSARRRFFNEARAAASIDHPNVARVIYLCPEDAAECSFAMELVEGETLARRITDHGPLAPGEALVLLRPIADALIALGARALVHRDIKPENIMSTKSAEGQGELKLIDFGLAKTVAENSSIFESVHTGERFVGSVYFASPEQIRPKEGIDCRSDFYSLGATLWYVVTGAPPFTGTAFEVQEAHIYKEPPWEKIADFPEPIIDILRTLLAKEAADRPATATALVAQWDGAIAGIESFPTRIEPSRKATSPPAPVPASPTILSSALLPDEAALPPHSGSLSRDPTTGAMQFVRPIPSGIGAELLSTLTRAAQTAQSSPHPGLLSIRSVSDTCIVSDWPAAVTAAQIAKWHRGAPFSKLVFRWLPAIAAAIDFGRARGLAHLGLQPERILVGIDFSAGGSLQAIDLAAWENARVWLDPLAGFDVGLVAAAKGTEAGGIGRRVPACTTVREYIAALARCIRDFAGGGTEGRPLPSNAFNETRSRMLSEAINYRSSASSVAEWAAAFASTPQPASEHPASAIVTPVIATSAAKAPPTPGTPAVPSPAPATAPTSSPAASSPRAKVARRGNRKSRKIGIALATLTVLGMLVGAVWIFVFSPDHESEEFRAVMASAETALAAGDHDRATTRANSAARINPKNKRLLALMERLKPAPPPAPTPQPIIAKTATPAPVRPATPADATLAAPFTNELGMRFVPVKITGPAAGGHPVLFSIYETRLKEFEHFAKKDAWQRQSFQISGDEPAVNLVPADAEAFCRWLNKHYPLPAKWEYRLPTDHEWSCAAGIGTDEDTEAANGTRPPAAKRFTWGATWPPDRPVGNFADQTFARTAAGREHLAGYDDGFAGTSPAGTFPPNDLGLFDLQGNAAEWCFDSTQYRLRGGSYLSATKSEIDLTSRGFGESDARKSMNGFRVVIAESNAASQRDGRSTKIQGAFPPTSAPMPPWILTR